MTSPAGDPNSQDPNSTDPNSTDPNADPNKDPAGGADPNAGDPAAAANPRVAQLESQYAQSQRELTEAKEKLTEIERAAMDETTRTKAERDDLQAKYETAQKALQDRSIENAFLMNNKHEWHNPATALRLLSRDDLKVQDDGSVVGIDAAIEALSKSDPYLLKAQTNGSGTGTGPKNTGGGSTGSQPGTGGGGKDNAATDRAKLEKKYPALRR